MGTECEITHAVFLYIIMKTAQTNLKREIVQRKEIYQAGLERTEILIAAEKINEALVFGLQTVVYSNTGLICEETHINILINCCNKFIDGFPEIDFSEMSIANAVERIRGVLIERISFYKQLENLTH